MQEALKAVDKEQVGEEVEAVLVVDVEAVLRLDRVGIVFAPNAVKKQPITWESLVMSCNAQSAAQQ